MPLTALALVLAAALLHASWNILVKKAGGGEPFILMNALMISVLWAPLALWVGWQDLLAWGWQPWGLAAASALVHLMYYRCLLRGYREADLTVVYPVARGSGPLITVVAAVLLLGEVPSWRGVLGALGVCLGVFVLAGGPGLWQAAHDPARRQRVRSGLRWGGLTGLLIAGYTVLDGYAVKVVLIAPIVLEWLTSLLRLPLLIPAQWRERAAFAQAWRRQWRASLVFALLAPSGYMLVLTAVTLAPLSHVAPAREVSILVAALLGGQLLGEGQRGLRLLGAALIAGGVVLLATGG